MSVPTDFHCGIIFQGLKETYLMPPLSDPTAPLFVKIPSATGNSQHNHPLLFHSAPDRQRHHPCQKSRAYPLPLTSLFMDKQRNYLATNWGRGRHGDIRTCREGQMTKEELGSISARVLINQSVWIGETSPFGSKWYDGIITTYDQFVLWLIFCHPFPMKQVDGCYALVNIVLRAIHSKSRSRLLLVGWLLNS